MTTFQFVALALLAVMIIATAAAIRKRRVAPRLGLFWLLIWILAGIFIAAPDLASVIANLLGIGRGADLVLYLSILFMLVAFFSIYLRFKRLDEQITRLVRHLAIRDADSSAPDQRER